MRTVSENRESLFEVGAGDEILLYGLESKESKSCFYELGDARSVMYGAYEQRPMPSIIDKIESAYFDSL